MKNVLYGSLVSKNPLITERMRQWFTGSQNLHVLCSKGEKRSLPQLEEPLFKYPFNIPFKDMHFLFIIKSSLKMITSTLHWKIFLCSWQPYTNYCLYILNGLICHILGQEWFWFQTKLKSLTKHTMKCGFIKSCW